MDDEDGPSREEALASLRAPGVAIFAIALIDLVISLVFTLGHTAFGEWANQLAAENPDFDPADFGLTTGNWTTGDVALTLLGFAVTITTLIGGWRMMQGRSWTLSLIAAILVMVPCFGACCGVFLPVGVWAVIVLLRDEVRGAMEA